MASKAEEAKHITCSKCGAPIWVIRGIGNDLVEYACLNGHVFTYKEKQEK